MKKVLIVFLLLLVVAAGVVYRYRYEIFQVSAESIIMRNLPPYVTVNRIVFDLENRILKVRDLGIRNPEGYSNKFLARIDEITCRYRMKGRNILDGIEVTEIVAGRPVIRIERLRDGRINVNEMGRVMERAKPVTVEEEEAPEKAEPVQRIKRLVEKIPFRRSISDLIKLTDTIDIKKGEVIFLDRAVSLAPHRLTFENINGKLVLGLSDDYREVLSIASRGRGFVNGDPTQRIDWVISHDPTARELTMSNRYEVRDVDIIQFRPYYDEHSPIIIHRGRFSGSLVFDFDHGNIGSMNTLVLKGLWFEVKEGRRGAASWQAVVIPDVIRYLQSRPGEVTFDFKIKGTIKEPRFYPGPHVKRAIQRMAIEKIAEALAGPEEAAKEGAQPVKTDIEKVVDLLKDLF